MFGVIGVLAALRHRDRTGEGQYVDIAMFDAMVAMTDIVTNFWSMGVRPEPDTAPLLIMRRVPRRPTATFVVQVGREHQFERLAELVGHPRVARRPALRDRARAGATHLDDVIRPAVEAWASTRRSSRPRTS